MRRATATSGGGGSSLDGRAIGGISLDGKAVGGIALDGRHQLSATQPVKDAAGRGGGGSHASSSPVEVVRDQVAASLLTYGCLACGRSLVIL